MQAVYLAYVLPVKAEIQSLDVFIYYTRLLYCIVRRVVTL